MYKTLGLMLIGNGYVWAMQIPKRVVLVRWLLTYYGIPVKSWMWGHCHDLKFDSCRSPIESVYHVYGYVLLLEQCGKAC